MQLSFVAGEQYLFNVGHVSNNGYRLEFGTIVDDITTINTANVIRDDDTIVLNLNDYTGDPLVYFESSIAGMGPDPEFVNTSVLGDWATYSGNSFTLTGSAYPFANGNYSLSQSVPSANYSNNLHRIILLETGTQADWHSELQSYNSTSGDYTANRSQEVTLGYNGCWVEITMPYKLQISQVSIRGRYINGTPKLAYLFGSNDGNQYNFIGQLNFIGTDELQSTSVSSTTGYKVVRMVVNKVHPSSGTTSLDYWELKGIPYPPIEYLVRKHTTNTTYEMSTDGGSTWTEKPRITFEANQPYKFDQSNSTNSGEQIVFGTTFDDKANVLGAADGVTIVGQPGTSGAYTQLILGADFSGDLYYYSAGSNGMGYYLSPVMLAAGWKSGLTSDYAYSMDNGNTWTYASTGIFDYTTSFAYNGTMWVAGGFGTNSLGYSYDGLNWTGVGNTIFTTSCEHFAWNGSVWVAGGFGTNTLAYSYDGINWTGLGNSIFTVGCEGLHYNGNIFIVGGHWTNIIAYSNDGINWNIPSQSVISAGFGSFWNDNKWVMGGQGSNSLITSNNGINWSGLGNTIFTERCRSVCNNGSIWVAGGEGTNTLAYSYDGTNWTGRGNAFITSSGKHIFWNGEQFLAGGSGANKFAYSSDGINWIASTNLNGLDVVYKFASNRP